jgi:hypothetical protein
LASSASLELAAAGNFEFFGYCLLRFLLGHTI